MQYIWLFNKKLGSIQLCERGTQSVGRLNSASYGEKERSEMIKTNAYSAAREMILDESLENVKLVESFFLHLSKMDFRAASSMFTREGIYRDEPLLSLDAEGPQAIYTKLSGALNELTDFPITLLSVVASGNDVVTTRVEEWHFPTGNILTLPVMCMHSVDEGQFSTWHEYWDLSTFKRQVSSDWLKIVTQETGATNEY